MHEFLEGFTCIKYDFYRWQNIVDYDKEYIPGFSRTFFDELGKQIGIFN